MSDPRKNNHQAHQPLEREVVGAARPEVPPRHVPSIVKFGNPRKAELPRVARVRTQPQAVRSASALLPSANGGSSMATAARMAFGSPPADLARVPENVLAQAMRGEYVYGALGLVVGFVSALAGMALGLHGLAGSSSWIAQFIGLPSPMSDVGPGVTLILMGLFVIWVTRPVLRPRDLMRD